MFGKSKNLIFDEKKFKRATTKKAAAKEETAAAPDDAAEQNDTLPQSTPPSNQKSAKVKKEKKPRVKKPKDAARLPFWRNRRAVGFTLVGFALIITFGANPILSRLNKQQTVIAVVANVDIPTGTEVTEEMVHEVQAVANALLPVQIMDKRLVVGKYAVSPIVNGEIISQPKLSDRIPFSNPYLYVLPEDKKALSVTVKYLSESVSGKLEPGDIVSVYVRSKEGDDNTAMLPPELTYVEVLAITNSEGIDITAPPEKSGLEHPLPETVTLAVDDLQATILVGNTQQGGIHLALVARGDANRAAELLAIQQVYNSKPSEEIQMEDTPNE